MSSTKCWHCHEIAQMVRPDEDTDGNRMFGTWHLSFFPDLRFGSRDDGKLLAIYSCVNCGYPNIALIDTSESEPNPFDFDPEEYIVRWLPIEPLGKDYPCAPAPIAEMASEAHKCYEIGAYRAAMMMARTALQAIVTEEEGTPSTKNLFERINDLKNTGKITARTADAATAIRLCGNDSAHNVVESVDDEYVDIVIMILDSMIEDLYANPQLVKLAKAYAQQRRAQQQEANHEQN